jgi:hypothetical protein
MVMRSQHHDPYDSTSDGEERSDWEDWEDENVSTPIETNDEPLIEVATPASPRKSATKTVPTRASQARQSVHKLKRLKSRQRQKAQNAKAGISLVTDMSKLRKFTHIAHQLREEPAGLPPKFVDAAALKALEGEPNSASVGSWNWLKRSRTTKANGKTGRVPTAQDLSPNDRPIVIGIAMPEQDLANRQISPQTAVLETPLDLPSFLKKTPQQTKIPTNPSPLTPLQQKSVWSPDTPSTMSPFGSPERASSVYSSITTFSAASNSNVPPVPEVPASYKKKKHQRLVSIEIENDDDEGDSPCTLFEEDGISTSPRKSSKAKAPAKSPDSAGGRSQGWWDHVTTPFSAESKSPLTPKQSTPKRSKTSSPTEEWWKNADEKKPIASSKPSGRPSPSPPPIVRVPTPKRTPSPYLERPSSASGSSSRSVPERVQTRAEKARVPAEVNETPTESPPPYSPPNKQTAVRFRAVFPPGHPLTAQYPPSPGPISPGIAGTMTSQGAISMTSIPLTPPPRTVTPGSSHLPLPSRAVGTFLPQEHSYSASGHSNRVERERRRHEKEEVMARKLGGFWRGRGCMPLNGCYGRTGREGRKRRRAILGIVGGVIATIILIVVLAVTLSRRGPPAKPFDDMWLNLTNFPPIPTGVVTFVGPDNPASVSGCTQPSTLWSCALPKEQHELVAPYNPTQPTVIMQIQWDNSTRELWNVPNGNPPVPGSGASSPEGDAAQVGGVFKDPLTTRDGVDGQTRSGIIARAAALVRGRQADTRFSPKPTPPSFREMFFLGNTTDGIVSKEKAGEPTPFYISIIKSVNATVGPNAIGKRQVSGLNPNITGGSLINLPLPDLEADGSGAPAQLLPNPIQQPLRLYDRGLPTEHYGFYTYFKRTIYLRSVTVLNNSKTDDPVPLDEDGGSRETEAKFLVTWAQTRMLVQIWTRSGNTTKLLANGSKGGINGTDGVTLIRPGTMPYPVTVTTDTHGGDPDQKFAWHYQVDDRQRIVTTSPKLLANDIGFAGTWVNRRSDRDESFGGFDGGSGGCRCEWVNFLARRPSSPA